MKNVLFALAVAGEFALVGVGTYVVAPPCEYEDGSSQVLCKWVGPEVGNHTGATYLELLKGRVTVYVHQPRNK